MKWYFKLSYLRHCAFTANPEEIITFNNFASTFDNADHSSYMASAPSDTIEWNWIESNLVSAESPSSNNVLVYID